MNELMENYKKIFEVVAEYVAKLLEVIVKAADTLGISRNMMIRIIAFQLLSMSVKERIEEE